MDMTLFQQPAVLVGIVSAIVGLIVKAVRMQTRVDRIEEDFKTRETAHAELKAAFAAHKDNSDIHFNLRISQEVDRRNEQRFVTIERQLGEINVKLDKIAEKE